MRARDRIGSAPLQLSGGLRSALLHTLPGRSIVVGVGIKLVVAAARALFGTAPAFLSVIETVAGLAVAAGLIYFLFRLLVLAKRRLLWRVRRKLILSYIFVGFGPAILLAAFALLCGFLLFYNLSSYLVQSRLRALSDQARFLAQTTALEIQRAGGQDTAGVVTRRQANIAAQYPDASVAVVPAERDCRAQAVASARAGSPTPPATAGPWRHVEVPAAIPSWIACSGFSGVLAYTHPRSDWSEGDTHILVRGVVFPDGPRPTYAVVVDLMVNDGLRQQLRRETGVELKTIAAVESEEAKPMAGRPDDDTAPWTPATTGVLSSLPSLMEFRDWTTGAPGTLTVTSGLNVAELYDRISAAEGRVGRNFGQGLLLVLFVIGALFMMNILIALVAGRATSPTRSPSRATTSSASWPGRSTR
jgi:hypothetical protein